MQELSRFESAGTARAQVGDRRVLIVAERVGNPRSVAQQRERLRDEDAAVRYWATIGFAANPEGARQARAELTRALVDSSSGVRIEAARALLGPVGEAAA